MEVRRLLFRFILCNCLRHSARSNNLLCFPKQRVARGKESVSNPSPNNTRDPAKRAKFLANCGSINPPYRTVLATCDDTLLALEPINQIVPQRPPGLREA